MAVPATAVDSPKVHVHLHVRDMAASVNFYRLLFGTEPVKLLPGYAKFLPTWGPVNLALSQNDADERGSVVSHLGVQLSSPAEVQRHLARVSAAGLPMRVEIGVDCCHANADKFWVIDPAGVDWEIYCLNYDLDPLVRSTEPVCTTTCCPA
jgi:catechol 2,3-dioxygenase-like lactoylglutathione lyase family enzyme